MVGAGGSVLDCLFEVFMKNPENNSNNIVKLLSSGSMSPLVLIVPLVKLGFFEHITRVQ